MKKLEGALTNAERQREWRKRQRKAKLVRVDCWIRPEHRERLRAYIDKLNREERQLY
jgi:hypothetical protein